jgi:hypothetical protein
MQYKGNQLYKPIEPYQSAFDTYEYHSNPRVGIHPVLDDILLAEDSYGGGVYRMMGRPTIDGYTL